MGPTEDPFPVDRRDVKYASGSHMLFFSAVSQTEKTTTGKKASEVRATRGIPAVDSGNGPLSIAELPTDGAQRRGAKDDGSCGTFTIL